MPAETPPDARCGLDTVEMARMEQLLAGAPPEQLAELFTATELADAGEGPRRVESLAARFAAKEACCKLFPRETALGTIQPRDFSVRRNAYGAPEIEVTANARAVLDRHLVRAIRVSLTHTETSASAVALAEKRAVEVPWFGRWLYYLVPFRRGIVLENMRRVFGDTLPDADIVALAQAFYAHHARCLSEFVRLPWMSAARKQKLIRVENIESPRPMRGAGA
jgi:holo-[acyl-carrier protein] synthase